MSLSADQIISATPAEVILHAFPDPTLVLELFERSGPVIAAANRAFLALTAMTADEIHGLPLSHVIDEAGARRCTDGADLDVVLQPPYTAAAHSDARPPTFGVRVRALMDEGAPDEGRHLLAVFRERTDHEVSETALRASMERQRQIANWVAEVFFQADEAGILTDLNKAWTNVTGWEREESLGQPFWNFVDKADIEALRASWPPAAPSGTGAATPQTLRVITADGKGRTVAMSAFPFDRGKGDPPGSSFIGKLVDLTDQLALEVELRHSQKLEAVGRLAAGIAHEINTPMQFVGDNVSFLGDSFTSLVDLLVKYRAAISPGAQNLTWAQRVEVMAAAETEAEADYLQSEIPRAVREALEGAERVASIVRSMKAFGHPDGATQSATDLNSALRNTLTVARNEYKYVADVETDFGELAPVLCHTGSIGQVFLNLLLNAAHAIEDKVGDTSERGVITVRTVQEEDVVVVTIADTGCGVPEALHDRVYDPFFTTKEVGRGTGQGLALVRSVIDRHQGSVSFTSSPDGTTFTIRLPVDGIETPGGLT